jgi:hypothetical protein
MLILDWDLSVIIELFSGRGELIPAYLISIIIGGLIYLIVMQFLNGGIYFVIVSGNCNPLKWREFFAECGMGFITHIKITLMAALIYLIMLPVGFFLVNMVGILMAKLFDISSLMILATKFGIFALIFLAISIFSDTVRATFTAAPDKQLIELIRVAFIYFRPQLLRLMGTFLITYLPFMAIWIFVEWTAIHVVGFFAGIVGILIELILLQIASFTRTGQKLWYLTYLGQEYRTYNPGRFSAMQAELPLRD